LLAIQQREQLKGLLVNKFLEKYGKNKEVSEKVLTKELAEFMKNEKLTEENLRKFEQRIKEGKLGQNHKAESIKEPQHDAGHKQDHQHPLTQSAVEQLDLASLKDAKQNNNVKSLADDQLSASSSQRPRSVYQLGDEDDEWAIMMKYDAELHKKERELEKYRDQEQKRKIKEELDRQLQEKRKYQEREQGDLHNYRRLVDSQLNQFDQRERRKEDEMKSKIMAEK